MEQWVLEVIGYVASVLVAISLMMSSILKLRLINLMGSAAFTVYGSLIGAYPVAAVNGFIVLINLYYLHGMLGGRREYFRLLEVGPDSEYLRDFLTFYRDEIRRFLPDFSFDEGSGPRLTFFVLRDMVPAGLFIGEVLDGRSLLVRLDFVIPQFRDFKTGRYVFAQQAGFFRSRGIVEILSAPGSPRHEAYLRRMGFRAEDRGAQGLVYRLSVA